MMLILFQCFGLCSGKITLELQLKSFVNPTGDDYEGDSCDVGLYTKCDHSFELCLEPAERLIF